MTSWELISIMWELISWEDTHRTNISVEHFHCVYVSMHSASQHMLSKVHYSSFEFDTRLN